MARRAWPALVKSCARSDLCALACIEEVDGSPARAHARAPLRVIVDGGGRYWITYPGGEAALYGTTPQGTPYIRIVQLTLVE